MGDIRKLRARGRIGAAIGLVAALAMVGIAPMPSAGASPTQAMAEVSAPLSGGDIVLASAPTIASLTPSSGSVAGGTSVVIALSNLDLSGVALSDVTVTIGATTATVVATTSATVDVTTVASPNRAAGAVNVEVAAVVGGQTLTASVPFGYIYRPVFEAPRTSGFGDWAGTDPGQLLLGSFASRTQGKPVTTSGSTGERTISGIDSRTGEAYSFSTDRTDYAGIGGKGHEGTEFAYANGSFGSNRYLINLAETFDGRSGVLSLRVSPPSCSAFSNVNPVTGNASFCSVFGPEVFSEPFYASSSQALSFGWAAQYVSDDYEVYGFLVRVDDPAVSTAVPTRATASAAVTAADPGYHTVVMYSRGCRGSGNGCVQQTSWFTSSGNVPADGHYRFRFVNGTWDYSGGKALGARMNIDPTIVVGAANVISFPDPGARFGPAGYTFTIPVSSSALVPVTLTSSTTAVCTVSSVSAIEATIAIVGTGNNRNCTLQASQGAVGNFAPASTVTRTFVISGPSAPVTAPLITSATGQNQSILVEFTPPANDGGSPILDYQYRVDGGSETTVTLGAAASFTISTLTNGTEYEIDLRARNALGVSPWSATVAATPAAPPVAAIPLAPPPPPVPPTRPVITGAPPAPLVAPTGTIGGRPATITVAPTPPPPGSTTPTAVAVTAGTGTTRFGVDLTGAGAVITETVAGTEVPVMAVTRDAVAATSGSGMLPRSTVQVWLPRDGDDIRKVTEIEVAPDGTYTGTLPFDGSTDDRPLPIGTHALQFIGTDPVGDQVVVNLTVRIDQPAPAPETERASQDVPTVTPGEVLVTNAGEIEVVDLIVDPDNGRTALESRGWDMGVDVPDAAGQVSRSESGGALIEIIRDEEARVAGTGFMPGTRADVWLFSTPTLLGSVTIGADGTFSGAVNIDGEVVEVGSHTMQLQGVGTDGYVRAANLGLFVVDTAAAGDRRLPAAGADHMALWILALAIMGIGVLLVRGRRSPLTQMS